MRTELSLRHLAFCILLAWGLPALADGEKPKPEERVLTNPAKNIHVLVDKASKETLVEFFQSRHIVVGGIKSDKLADVIRTGKAAEKTFVNYSSHNDDRKKEALFGSIVTLAPLSADAGRLVKPRFVGPTGKKAFAVTVVLERDPKVANRYHVVGVMTRRHVGFFSDAKRTAPDKFAPADLRFRKK